MNIRKIVLWMLFLALAAVVSEPLALLSEGIGLQTGFPNATPGLAIAHKAVPPSSDRGFETLSKQMDLQLKIDRVFWFVVLCAIAVTVALYRRRHQTHGSV
jgi:hypothetical protein